MLFDVCGRIKKLMDKAQLLQAVEDFFKTGITMTESSETSSSVLFEGVLDRENIRILLSLNTNGFDYESDILDSDYTFVETVALEVAKSSASLDEDYKTAFEFLMFLAERFAIEMLVTLDYEDEICFVSSDGCMCWNEAQKYRFCSIDN